MTSKFKYLAIKMPETIEESFLMLEKLNMIGIDWISKLDRIDIENIISKKDYFLIDTKYHLFVTSNLGIHNHFIINSIEEIKPFVEAININIF